MKATCMWCHRELPASLLCPCGLQYGRTDTGRVISTGRLGSDGVVHPFQKPAAPEATAICKAEETVSERANPAR